ncbi:phosphoribosyltransferase [Niabella sp. CC-SYL272]|uniref:phosphoribosyltransferase n=1 Tax=Niabella agricola TaxID=2891571 RepID=UPI001F422658|nr:phosphoribosyltransferase family protein [Niabella agricola]MCF3107673.1 phosphoribosyltransferase [Niabella agricola]
MFKDRTEAGSLLAVQLKKYKNEPGIVLAIPRGGIPVACIVAKQLKFPMSVVLTKKIGHPLNKEYAIGAASLTDYFLVPHENVSEQYIQEELKSIRIALNQMHEKLMGKRPPEKLEGKTLIVVDDGIATGSTMLATINLLRHSNPRKIIIAVPVASQNAIQKLSKQADEVVTVLSPEVFSGVGAFYNDFTQVSDTEAISCMKKSAKPI